MAPLHRLSVACVLALVFLVFIRHGEGHGHAEMYKEPGSCTKEDGKCAEEVSELARLDGVGVGYRKKLAIEPGQTHYAKTLSMAPLILEIENFLSDDECEHVIKVAQDQGLENSVNATADLLKKQIHVNDFDGDSKLNVNEMRMSLENTFDIYFEEEDILKMYTEMLMDPNGDKLISKEELDGVKTANFIDYVSDYIKKHPECQSAQSKQAKISVTEDDVINKLQRRISKTLRLHNVAMATERELFVWQYEEGGFENANIDSAPLIKRVPCCHVTDAKSCRNCRYATVLLYLSDVEEGGETAFPVAQNETYNPFIFRTSNKRNLQKHCKESNMAVKPGKGKALIWYSHFPDGETGGMGEADEKTWNGQCPVTKGTEWLAKVWINVDTPEDDDEN